MAYLSWENLYHNFKLSGGIEGVRKYDMISNSYKDAANIIKKIVLSRLEWTDMVQSLKQDHSSR